MPTRPLRRAFLIFAVLAVAVGLAGATLGSAGPPKKLRIGLVLDDPNVNDPFSRGANVGLQRAVKELGVAGKVVVPSPHQSLESSFADLARQRYDLIVGIGSFEVSDLDAAARAFPKSRFAIIDASLRDLAHRPRNVRGGVFRTEQASYLAGYLAALTEERRLGKDVIGSVGGVKIPTVDEYIGGFQAGAKAANPRITLLNGYSGDFATQSKCRALALQQAVAGAGVIFQVANDCGLGALAVAKQKHVWGVGADVDQSYLGPHILTSVVKNLDGAVFDTISDLRNGSFRSGANAVFDLQNGGVGLGKISPKVPRSLLQRLARIRAEIVAGKIVIPVAPITP